MTFSIIQKKYTYPQKKLQKHSKCAMTTSYLCNVKTKKGRTLPQPLPEWRGVVTPSLRSVVDSLRRLEEFKIHNSKCIIQNA